MASDYRIFVGTVGEGVFCSDDGGKTFARCSQGMFVECDVRALATHAGNSRVVYAGTSEGVYRSDDRGDSWVRLESPMNQLITWSLLVSPHDPETLYAGTRPAHLFRSTDAGRTWTQLGATIAQHCNNIIYNRVTTILSDPDDRNGLWAGVEIDAVQHRPTAAKPGPGCTGGCPRRTSTGWPSFPAPGDAASWPRPTTT